MQGSQDAVGGADHSVDTSLLSANPFVMTAPRPGVALATWLQAFREDVVRVVDETGAVLLRGFEIGGASGLERSIESFYGPALEYPGDLQSVARRKAVDGRISTSTEYSAGLPLRLHSECSFGVSWPMHIYFLAELVATSGGATPIADNHSIYRRIDPSIRESFERRGVMYLRNFGFGSTPPWQDIFNSNDRSVVETRCRAEGITPEWIGAGGLRLRAARPAVVRHARTGEPLWFNHVNTIHITGHPPDLLAAFRNNFAPDELPRHCVFGDGEEIDDDIAAAIRDVYDAETRRFSWHAGDVLILDNMRCSHGRDPFQGSRRVLVGMSGSVRRASDASIPDCIEVSAE